MGWARYSLDRRGVSFCMGSCVGVIDEELAGSCPPFYCSLAWVIDGTNGWING